MRSIKTLFLEALACSLKNQDVTWSFEISCQQWQQLFDLACRHRVMPMIYTAVQNCFSFRCMDSVLFNSYRTRAVRLIVLQTVKTNELLELLDLLYQSDLHPLIVKGCVCRVLYPHPDERESGDEDLLIPQHEFEACQSLLLAHGWHPADGKIPFSEVSDIAYHKEGHFLRIELHPQPFAPESEIFGAWNDFFRSIYTNAAKIYVHGRPVYTVNVTDHLFFLICHALKHFLHSGFGIRQVCDIILFANHYGADIDWAKIFNQCNILHAGYFAAAIFKIGQKYLVFDPLKARCPAQFYQSFDVDEKPLLKDILSAGLYGDASVSRKHSSLLMLYAMKMQRNRFILLTYLTGSMTLLFPEKQATGNRYTSYRSKSCPLPFVWLKRWQKYFTDGQTSHPVMEGFNTIKLGKQRIQMIKQYKLTESRKRKKEE